ncbi:MAG: DnaJ domain-containing protein [Woronichinia naegeliana WA131]|jgi:WD40 repeat protein|uniref:DnaJ domain-containing protein n=1 Tax=Woronichinia naegeliana WA131 TaxID=2824559 RepID=A0A977L480_9CYAN|nr:MAG: DnaJ domain-containing protein [Woronichinia naegeliana WA131]
MINLKTDQGFVVVGAATGQVIASQIGGVGVVGGFGGMALGTPVIVVGGAIAGAAIQGIVEGIETGDVKILGVTTLGSVLGAGFSAAVGKVGVGVAGSAFGVGMGTMAATGGLLALGVYQLIKMCGNHSSSSKYFENLLFLEQITEEYENEKKWHNLEIENELQELKNELEKNLLENNSQDYQWQPLENEEELENLKEQLTTYLQNEHCSTKTLYDSNDSQQEQGNIILINTPNFVWEPRDLTHFESHPVSAVAIAPNNQYFFSGDSKGIVNLWDLNTHKLLFSFIGNREEIQAIVVSPDGQKLLAAGFDRRISAWQIERKSIFSGFYSLNSRYSHEGVIHALTVSPDGQLVVSGGSDHKIKIWGGITGKWERTLNGHTDSIFALVFSTDGKMLVSGSADKTIRLWHLSNYQEPEILQGHDQRITCLEITNNNQYLISGSLDGIIHIWDLVTKTIVKRIKAHSQGILSLAINNISQILATANYQEIKLWDLETGKLLQTLAGCHPIKFSADGKILVTGNPDQKKVLTIWRYNVGKFKQEQDNNFAFDFSHNWWDILGVSPNADPQEIKLAYYYLAKQFHPDQNNCQEAVKSMQVINHAYNQFRRFCRDRP